MATTDADPVTGVEPSEAPGAGATATSARAEAYLEGIRALLPRLRERSAEAEALRRMPDATMADLEAAGVFAAVQPQHWGGLELDPATVFEGVVLVGSACSATGWIASVVGVHPWEVACMHPDAQCDLWGRDPRTRVSSSYAPTGSATRVADGYLLGGRWGFSSGVDHCGWALLGAVVEGEKDAGIRVFLVPRTAFAIDQESWHVAGLSATGSKDLRVQRVFVPEHRTHLMEAFRTADLDRPGWALNPGPLYRLTFSSLFSWGIAAPALGAATGMVKEHLAQSKARIPAFGGPPVAHNVALHLRMAEGIGQVDMLTRAMVSSWQEQWATVVRGESVDPVSEVRFHYAGARTIAESLDAALTVFAQAGGGAMDVTNPLQRFLRDLLAMRNHPVAALDRFATAQALCELDVPAKRA